jgi:hypothetical protein
MLEQNLFGDDSDQDVTLEIALEIAMVGPRVLNGYVGSLFHGSATSVTPSRFSEKCVLGLETWLNL